MNRILEIKNLDEARKELKNINTSSQGIAAMATKALQSNIKLTNVLIGAANILKQEMLSIGGDAAVARGVVNGKIERSDVILLGNADKIKKLIQKLNYQTIFELPQIKEDLEKILDNLLNRKKYVLKCKGKEIILEPTKIIGILNITPDSFSDGNKFMEPQKAIEHALQMVEEGADIIDIGGESTRPGAQKVDLETEKQRVIPIIKELYKLTKVPISVDTYKSEIAEEAILAGASIINDISALRFDKNMKKVLKKYKEIPIILMHMQGTPGNMQQSPFYKDTIEEILSFLKEQIDNCVSSGISKNRIIIDPGIGFGKRQSDNLIILHKLSEFHSLNVPVILGASRKSFIGKIYEANPINRLEGSLATTALAFQNRIEFIRVHNVKAHKRFLQTLQAIEEV